MIILKYWLANMANTNIGQTCSKIFQGYPSIRQEEWRKVAELEKNKIWMKFSDGALVEV
ncbi:hypothetical protein N007_18960 [Alicyclobacillus acidoterrestris ATCC 49025]|nr:hypothetical protein N007_18960 [Alicyclobacillus acidoterrestris ATCC 49025]